MEPSMFAKLSHKAHAWAEKQELSWSANGYNSLQKSEATHFTVFEMRKNSFLIVQFV